MKFKIWDKENKRWVTGDQPENDDVFTEEDKPGHYEITHWSSTEIVYHINKQDMHGIDIYEGDIIRKEECAPDDPAYGEYGSIGVVKEDPHDMGWYIDSEDSGFYDNMGINFSFDEIEIIGNIYNNPELLD